VKSATETLSPTRVKLTVEIPFEELRPSLDTAYQKIGKQIQVPGFRKGKVPPVVVDQRIGRAAVLDEAVNDALPKMYMQALEDNELKPLGQPEVDVTNFSDGEVLEFTAEVDIRPEITLPDYSGLQASVADLAVTDDEVEEQLQGLRERFGAFKDLDRPAAEGDHVTIDLVASENGEPIEGGQVEGQSYEVGKGTMVEGLDEALIGLSAGESATFQSQLVGGDLAGKDVDIQVTVHAVKEQELPELDDEFAQTASEFDTVEEMRADLRERLLRAKRLEQASEARDSVLEVLLGQVEVPLPEGVVA
jgi:trigger factor